jgi:predicted RNA-binding protein YlxR (DUF448 family)
VGCRRVGAPDTLLRCAATPAGVAVGRNLPGRGAWVCPGEACIQLAVTRGALARALGLRREAIGEADGRRLLQECLAPGGVTRVTKAEPQVAVAGPGDDHPGV